MNPAEEAARLAAEVRRRLQEQETERTRQRVAQLEAERLKAESDAIRNRRT